MATIAAVVLTDDVLDDVVVGIVVVLVNVVDPFC